MSFLKGYYWSAEQMIIDGKQIDGEATFSFVYISEAVIFQQNWTLSLKVTYL